MADYYWELVSSGVNFSSVELGGLDCKYHVSGIHRALETVVGLAFGVAFSYAGARALAGLPAAKPSSQATPHPLRIRLLAALAFAYGVEVSYKFVSKQVIVLLFPCHVVSAIWIYLLSCVKPSAADIFLYRVNLHLTHGTLLAIFFPVDDSLSLPMEREIYWVQHILLLLAPVFMLCFERDAFPPPPVTEKGLFSWPFFLITYGIWAFWHWVVMQGVSWLTLVNIGHMLCPATSDPFAGPMYRPLGIVHQIACVLVSTVLVGLVNALGAKISGEVKEKSK